MTEVLCAALAVVVFTALVGGGILALLVATAALAGWAWTLVRLNASFLPYAQGLQALHKLNDQEDEKIRKVLASFKTATDQQVSQEGSRLGAAGDELAEIRRRAEAMGFSVNGKGAVSENRPLTPVPEPGSFDNLPEIDVVE